MVAELILTMSAVAAVYASVRAMRSAYSDAQGPRELLRGAPLVAIREVTEGQLVRVKGRVRCTGSLLHAPLSGRACAAWSVRVLEGRDRSGAPFMPYDNAIAFQDSIDFLLEDGTGRARVSGGEAVVVDGRREERYEGSMWKEPPAAMQEFLDERRISQQGLLFRTSQLCEERILLPGSWVTVLAVASWEPDPEPDGLMPEDAYRGPSRRLVLTPPKRGKVLVSYDPDTVDWPGNTQGSG